MSSPRGIFRKIKNFGQTFFLPIFRSISPKNGRFLKKSKKTENAKASTKMVPEGSNFWERTLEHVSQKMIHNLDFRSKFWIFYQKGGFLADFDNFWTFLMQFLAQKIAKSQKKNSSYKIQQNITLQVFIRGIFFFFAIW